MLHDARMQILYYKESADVLLEFGLQGNYSMRLLTVQTGDYKSFLEQLAKAVDRNSIILTVGGFDADDRLPEILGRAIGQPLVFPEASVFHIQKPMPTKIPQGAVPLVTEDGTLAGCVIEQGLQSIIMLCADATLRRQVFKKLVIPYIGDRLTTIAAGQRAKTVVEHTPPLEEVADIPPQAEAPATQASAPPEDLAQPPQTDTPEVSAPPIQPPESEPEEPEFEDISSVSQTAGTQEPPKEPQRTAGTGYESLLPPPTENQRSGHRGLVTFLCILLAVVLALGAALLLGYVLQQKNRQTPPEKVLLWTQQLPTDTWTDFLYMD